MSEVKWIKLNTNMFDDEKIKLIEQMPDADSVLVIWIKLLSQAGKANASGYIYLNENIPYTDEMLSTIFNRPLLTVRMALNTFKQFGMIDIDENHFISIENWEKHQNVDGMAKLKEQNRKRVAEHREKKKLELCNVTGNVTVTQCNALDIELELELELELEEEKERTIVDKIDVNVLFEEWWTCYNKKTGRAKCFTKYKSLLKKNSHEAIMNGTKRYINHLKSLQSRNEFCPPLKNPLTFLNGEHFNDEYEGFSGTSIQLMQSHSVPVSETIFSMDE